MAGKYALIIGVSNYSHPKFARLVCTCDDIIAIDEVLSNPKVGGFQVETLGNPTSQDARKKLAAFFQNRSSEDVLLVYFTGHGGLDKRGRMYFAFSDTDPELPEATAIPASYISDLMDGSYSSRQILVLDSCYAGAFALGTKGEAEQTINIQEALKGNGYGRIVIAATGSTSPALVGDQVIQESIYSLFTHYFVEGLRTGQADIDKDGNITIDNLFDYQYLRQLCCRNSRLSRVNTA